MVTWKQPTDSPKVLGLWPKFYAISNKFIRWLSKKFLQFVRSYNRNIMHTSLSSAFSRFSLKEEALKNAQYCGKM